MSSGVRQSNGEGFVGMGISLWALLEHNDSERNILYFERRDDKDISHRWYFDGILKFLAGIWVGDQSRPGLRCIDVGKASSSGLWSLEFRYCRSTWYFVMVWCRRVHNTIDFGSSTTTKLKILKDFQDTSKVAFPRGELYLSGSQELQYNL